MLKDRLVGVARGAKRFAEENREELGNVAFNATFLTGAQIVAPWSPAVYGVGAVVLRRTYLDLRRDLYRHKGKNVPRLAVRQHVEMINALQ